MKNIKSMRQLLLQCFIIFGATANAQTIPKSIDKPIITKTQNKVITKQRPVNTEKNKDSDEDGLIDAIDECPDEKGTANNNGCPAKYWKRKYDEVGVLVKGLHKIKLNGQFGFADAEGKEIIPAKYDFVDETNEELIKVKLNNKYGYLNYVGEIIIPIAFDAAWTFSGYVKVLLKGEIRFINKFGRDQYQNMGDFSEGLVRASSWMTGKYGFVNTSGEVVIPMKFDFASSEGFSEGLAEVRLSGKDGFINKAGEIVIPTIYDDAFAFSEGLASVRLGNKRGFINKSGEVIIPIKFYWAQPFSNGMAKITNNGKDYYIDKTGKCVKDCN